MAYLLVFISLYGISFLATTPTITAGREMVVYWGQDWRNPVTLEHLCKNSEYNTVVLAFLQTFFDSSNKNLPSLTFSSGCNSTVGPDYPNLPRCYGIEMGVRACQLRQKKVLLSLGGFLGNYSFDSDNQAVTFARTLWNLFLNGNTMTHLRPFGSVVLDGIDLDIEKGSPLGYAAFVKEMHTLMTADRSKAYKLTAVPGCPFPDQYLGPNSTENTNTAFTLHGHLFTDIYLQCYCCSCVPGSDNFWRRFTNWNRFAGYVAGNNSGIGPKVYIGLAAHPDASGIPGGEVYYRPLSDIKDVFNRAKTFPTFGGFMLWNAGFDGLSVMDDGRTFGHHVRDILYGIDRSNNVSLAVIIIVIVILVGFLVIGGVVYWKNSKIPPSKKFKARR